MGFWQTILAAALGGAAASTTTTASVAPEILSDYPKLGIVALIGAASHVAAVMKETPARVKKD